MSFPFWTQELWNRPDYILSLVQCSGVRIDSRFQRPGKRVTPSGREFAEPYSVSQCKKIGKYNLKNANCTSQICYSTQLDELQRQIVLFIIFCRISSGLQVSSNVITNVFCTQSNRAFLILMRLHYLPFMWVRSALMCVLLILEFPSATSVHDKLFHYMHFKVSMYRRPFAQFPTPVHV